MGEKGRGRARSGRDIEVREGHRYRGRAWGHSHRERGGGKEVMRGQLKVRCSWFTVHD